MPVRTWQILQSGKTLIMLDCPELLNSSNHHNAKG